MKSLWNKALDMPPAWLVYFLLLVWLQTRVWNPLEFQSLLTSALGWGLIAAGLLLASWAFAQFRAHETSIIPRNTPSAMITRGPYRFSRNPIYLADVLLLAGFSLLQGSVIGLILLPLFMWVINLRFIQGEEAGLRAKFPEDFAKMCETTRRWI